MRNGGLNGAFYRNQVIVYGTLHVCEITKQTACDAVCCDVSARGGEIIRIDSELRDTGASRKQTVYTIFFTLPEL